MLHWLRRLALTAAFAGTALLAACGGSDDHDTVNIVETAKADARFSILVEAVNAADPAIAAALTGPGPQTVFAPTNDAFAALLTELNVTKAQRLADTPLLNAVLRYHLLNNQRARSAGITATDTLASNGVIHVIDKVILPRP